ncbi:wax ester/triacylglycerol synthase family O-acyltransferase [Marinobacteraceae bacterium S3BR75-40.1]
MSHHMEPMSSVDTAWLRMESESNLMMICGVWVLDRPIDMDRFRAVIEQRLLRFDRFRQRVVHKDGEEYWEEDPHFYLENHIHRAALPGAAGKEELQDFVSDLASTPLDFNHPLWQFHLIDKYEEGAAMVARIHHCIADGIALVRVMLSLADEAGDRPRPEYHKEPKRDFLSSLMHPLEQMAERGAHLGHELVEETLDLVRHPNHLAELAEKGRHIGEEWLEKGRHIGEELARLGLMPRDTRTHLHKPLTGRKAVAWADPLSLNDVKDTAHLLTGTVNDVLMTAAAGALRRYLMEADRELKGNIHVAVPFNLRPLDKPIEKLGNEFGLVMVELPLKQPDPIKRFHEVQANMRQLKESVQPMVTFGLLSIFGAGPANLEKAALDFLSEKSSLVMTNVPGPKSPLTIAGAHILQPLVWVPQSGSIGVGLSILSYAGTVQFGLIADQAQIHDPNRVARYFLESFEELKSAIHGKKTA